MRSLFGVLAGLLAVACGGAGSDADASGEDVLGPLPHEAPAQVSRLETLAASDLDALAAEQATLAAALERARGLAGDGAVVTFAGALEDELSNTATFAELSGAAGTAVAAWVCVAEACRALVASPRDDAEPTFTDAAGAPVEAPALAAPALQMLLPGNSLDDPAAVVTGALQGDDFPALDVTRRRFVVASAWGRLFDLDLSGVLAAATASGAYDSVESYPYVSLATLDRLMTELKEGDVLVWVGAGVGMKATSQGTTKTVGLTSARALFGAETVHVGRVRELLEGNPFRDLALPSLLVLAGGRTWGDGAWNPLTDDDEISPDSLIRNLQVGDHAVVAVEGDLDARALEDGLATLFDGLFAGQALGEVVAAASGRLERMGLEARWKRLPEAPAVDLTLPAAVDDYWATTPLKKAPTFAELSLRVSLNYTCLDAQSGVPYTPDALEDMVQNLYVREITGFDGPVFTKSWTYDSKGENVTVQARLPEMVPGARFVLSARGDVSGRMCDVQLYALARVLEVTDGHIEGKGDYVEVRFTGNVDASTFLFPSDGKCVSGGETCRLNASETTTEALSHNSEPSWIRLFH